MQLFLHLLNNATMMMYGVSRPRDGELEEPSPVLCLHQQQRFVVVDWFKSYLFDRPNRNLQCEFSNQMYIIDIPKDRRVSPKAC